ncbi:hypothetical protein MANES_13G140472v8 [Manihot esculenta]|uniref:Uncharacterized protein n=1 Tax=Manihot esculenta TaxID=3983 RepID=A0ACB7GLX6_MANES|nr:hypothetical protein MANES_13G140472v8 [Manihot esculenta]
MSKLKIMSYSLGLEIEQGVDGIFVSQMKYVIEMLKKFNLDKCKSMAVPFVVNEKLNKDDGTEPADIALYRCLVGSLIYLTTCKPDLMYSARLLYRFMHSPCQLYFVVDKRVLRYLKDIVEFGLWFQRGKTVKLEGYVDSDWVGSVDDSKSTSFNAFFLGSSPFSWNSRKAEVVAQSIIEAEYTSTVGIANQSIWLRKL